MVVQSFLKNSKRLLFPHRVCLLIADDSKYRFAFFIAPGINGYAARGAIVTIPGFIGGFPVVKYPTDGEFSPRSDEGGILEYP
jgi:hypothetical protein